MLTLFALCRYKIYPISKNSYWPPFNLVQALKGRTFNGHSQIPLGNGKSRLLASQNASLAVNMVGEMAKNRLTIPAGTVLVPMPDSGCTITAGRNSKVRALAERMAAGHAKVTVWDGLRWTQAMTPSTQGGPRDPAFLYPRLALVGKPPKNDVLLVDDVVTSGGHLRAAAAFFGKQNISCTHCVAAARTVQDEDEIPFGTVEETFLDYVP